MADEFKVEKHATFLDNFELWIEPIVTQETMSEPQLIERVKESYERSLKANVEHHDLLAKTMQDQGETQSAKHHRVMANVYKALLE